MKSRFVPATLVALALALPLGVFSAGCSKKDDTPKGGNGKGDTTGGKAPVFTLAWSEYPSWSVFGVASEVGLIDGAEGKQGSLEKKWGVDIVLELLEYDKCIQKYASGKSDSVCVTNIDVLAPALTRDSVAILPTSTSVGGDALLVVGIDVKDKKKALEELKKHKVFGLAKSVSEYAFDRNLGLLGADPKNFKFTDEQPDVAALAMAAKKDTHKAIMVWNPFVLNVLQQNPDARVLFDSSTIPEEIIDMVVVGKDSLNKPKGKEFACCVIDTYYEMNKLLQDKDQKKADQILVKLGEKFSKLGLEDMKKVVTQTRFFKNPEEAMALLSSPKFQPMMKSVVQWCMDKDMLIQDKMKKEPTISYDTAEKGKGAQLQFDTSYIKAVKDYK
jgi:NitT/TauT family transport system substrate-binding protein